jgi:ADP-ribosylglycohydrolase
MHAMAIAARRYDDQTAVMIEEVIEYRAISSEKILDKWRGWAGHEAVAASLWCFLKHPDDYEKAVLLAVNSPGDSDSLGAITGALVGARVGLSGIPERWVDTVEDKEGLEVLASRIITRLG